jgi:peptide/nickel transport system substrate-binding protein
MQRRHFLAGASATLLAGCGGKKRDPRVLRFAPEGNLSSPDPVWSTTSIASIHGLMIWDTLYGFTRGRQPRPQMVAGHELSGDELTWRFTLRDGLIWHDGERVLARDCTRSIQRWAKRRSFGQRLLSQLNEIAAIDDKRFEIRLKRPFPLMLSALGRDLCFMMPERIAKTDPFEQIQEYIGSGPYIFRPDEWVSGHKAVYSRNPRYVPIDGAPDYTSGGKIAHFDRVEWLVITDPNATASALQRGEIDWWQKPLPDLLPHLRESPGVRVLEDDTIGRVALIAFNHVQPPWNNPKLRRALLPAIDQRAFMQAVWGNAANHYRIPCGVFTPGSPMANTAGLEALTGKRDLALARRLVVESDYAGEKIVLLSPRDYPQESALAAMTNDLFTRLGLNVSYVSTDWGTLVQRRASREPVEKGGWSNFSGAPDGSSLSDPVSHFPLRGNGFDGWFGWPTSPRIESLRDQWFDARDVGTQLRICKDIQRSALDEVPFIPLGQWFDAGAARTELVDIVKAPFPIFWGARKTG